MSPTEQTSPERLVAGPELDRLVAEACGIKHELLRMANAFGENEGFVAMVGGRMFSPSTDWNDAMLAADRIGLFDADEYHYLLRNTPNGWQVLSPDFYLKPMTTDVLTCEETGPLAICRAIIAAGKVKHG